VADVCLAGAWLGTYPPLFTSTSVNNCYIPPVKVLEIYSLNRRISRLHFHYSIFFQKIRTEIVLEQTKMCISVAYGEENVLLL